MKIGLTYNLKVISSNESDADAEYETPETISAIENVLSSMGDVIRLPCDENLLVKFLSVKPDLVFNIAEGWGGRDRESYVPVVCSMLGVPCTGSDAVSLAITMDKVLTKRVVRDAGVRTSDFILYNNIPNSLPPFGYPVFVKPVCEGSSRGIFSDSVVYDRDSLIKKVQHILNNYNQPALVEPYHAGRDFCVALLGNTPPITLTTCEVLLGHEKGIQFFSYEYKRYETDKLDMSPAIDKNVIYEMENMALIVWNALGCRDFARLDFRTDADGVPYFLEINGLPGLSPVSGIFVKQAEASGIGFENLIKKILERALSLAEKKDTTYLYNSKRDFQSKGEDI